MSPENPAQARRLTPMRPVLFEILLLLNENDLHGYGIMTVLKERKEGRFILGPGTLYRTLKEMKEMGLIEPAGRRSAAELNNQRRHYYSITPFGRRVASAEAQRMARLVRTADLGGLLSDAENR